MISEYVEFKCIKKMGKTSKQRFTAIVKEYEKRLNHVVSDGGTVYTLHDFDHHCFDLYKTVSNVILNGETAFEGNKNTIINDKELYILNLAILLHDLGMTKYVDLTRDNHSAVSAQMIKEEYKDSANPLSENKSGLNTNDIEALALIVQAHSDVKDGSVEEEVNGLRNPALTNSMPSRIGKIRARFLANILRMADELDITSDRLASMDVRIELEKAVKDKKVIEKQLESATNEQMKSELKTKLERYKSAEISEKRWKNLTLFKLVEGDAAGNVKLHIDDSIIESELARGESDISLAEDILNIYAKIYKEFEQFKKDTDSELRLAAMIAIKQIDIFTKNEKLNTLLEEMKKKNGKTVSRETIQPQVISPDMESKISGFIEERKLYEVGHYRLHENLCARDWIAVNEIISTEWFFKECASQLLLHLKNIEGLGDRYLIIGIDFYGMLVASRLAFILHKPYSYLIPSHREKKSSSKELNLDCSIDEFENVIIVTDVIVTFRTINILAEEYNIQKKIKAIYAILFRNTEDNEFVQKNKEIADKTYVLNSKFNIEVKENDNCRYKESEETCKASNITYD